MKLLSLILILLTPGCIQDQFTAQEAYDIGDAIGYRRRVAEEARGIPPVSPLPVPAFEARLLRATIDQHEQPAEYWREFEESEAEAQQLRIKEER